MKGDRCAKKAFQTSSLAPVGSVGNKGLGLVLGRFAAGFLDLAAARTVGFFLMVDRLRSASGERAWLAGFVGLEERGEQDLNHLEQQAFHGHYSEAAETFFNFLVDEPFLMALTLFRHYFQVTASAPANQTQMLGAIIRGRVELLRLDRPRFVVVRLQQSLYLVLREVMRGMVDDFIDPITGIELNTDFQLVFLKDQTAIVLGLGGFTIPGLALFTCFPNSTESGKGYDKGQTNQQAFHAMIPSEALELLLPSPFGFCLFPAIPVIRINSQTFAGAFRREFGARRMMPKGRGTHIGFIDPSFVRIPLQQGLNQGDIKVSPLVLDPFDPVADIEIGDDVNIALVIDDRPIVLQLDGLAVAHFALLASLSYPGGNSQWTKQYQQN
jgi:hypothetical protein